VEEGFVAQLKDSRFSWVCAAGHRPPAYHGGNACAYTLLPSPVGPLVPWTFSFFTLSNGKLRVRRACATQRGMRQ